MKISLVIPCYNEEKNIPTLSKKLNKLIFNKSYEIIMVDNGSSDNTYNVLNKFLKNFDNVIILKLEKNEGYGNGILKGLKIAKGNILAWTHADIQTDPQDIIEGVKFFKKRKKNIFVKGLRYGRPISDRFFTFGMSAFVSLILRKFLWDVNAQPTIMTSSFFESWKNPPKDFSLDLYSYYTALKEGYIIYRFPVLLSKRLFGSSKWNLGFKSKIRFIKRTIKYTVSLK